MRPSISRNLTFRVSTYFRMLANELLGVFPSLSQSFSFVGKPGAALINQLLVHSLIDKVPFIGNALVIQDVEFGFSEREAQACS